MPVFLEGLAIRFFRGIGAETQELGPFKEFNFFVGSNNSGKSTVLDLIHRYVSTEPNQHKLETLDTYTGAKTGPFYFAVGIADAAFSKAAIEKFRATGKSRFGDHPPPHYEFSIRAICKALAADRFVWLTLKNGKLVTDAVVTPEMISSVKSAIHPNEWQDIWNVVTGQGSGALGQHWVPQTLREFFNAQKITLPKVRFIPANRQIGQASEEFKDFSGRGLIDRLAELQSPDHDKRHELSLFARIQ